MVAPAEAGIHDHSFLHRDAVGDDEAVHGHAEGIRPKGAVGVAAGGRRSGGINGSKNRQNLSYQQLWDRQLPGILRA